MTRAWIIERFSDATARSRRRAPRAGHGARPGSLKRRALTPAAVLVPLIDRTDGMTVLLTQRTEHVGDHAGQISFPGGRIEPHDTDPEAAALRETEEEIGLAPDRIEVIGRLNGYETTTGFRVIPVVGLIRPPLSLKLDPFEVAEVFEVPLAFILDPANHARQRRIHPVLPPSAVMLRRTGRSSDLPSPAEASSAKAGATEGGEGVERRDYVLPYEDRYIWGATAGMLINLYEVLSG